MGFDNDLQDVTPKTQTTEAKIDKWNYIKLKNFFVKKETISRVEK